MVFVLMPSILAVWKRSPTSASEGEFKEILVSLYLFAPFVKKKKMLLDGLLGLDPNLFWGMACHQWWKLPGDEKLRN